MIIFSFLFFLLMPAFLARAFLGGGWGGVALVGFLIRVKNAPPLKKTLKDLSLIKKKLVPLQGFLKSRN